MPEGDVQDKIVGKFDNQASFETGFRNIALAVGMPVPDTRDIVGIDGQARTIDEAVVQYKAMERIQSRMNAVKPADPPPEPAQPPVAKPDEASPTQPDSGQALSITPQVVEGDATIEQVLTAIGSTPEAIAQEWNDNNNQLTEQTYARIASVNAAYGKNVVDAVIDGIAMKRQTEAQRQAHIKADAVAMVGGEQQLNVLLQSASVTVPAEEFADLNERLSRESSYKGAMRDLQAFHAQAVEAGNVQPLAEGDRTPSTGGSGYIADVAEYKKTINDAAKGDAAAQERLRSHRAARKGNPIL